MSMVEKLSQIIFVSYLKPRAFVRAHESPVSVLLDSLHEEIWDPEGEEEIPGSVLLLAGVLLRVEEVEDVRVPRLQVHGKGAGTLVAALVDVARRVVEHAHHREKTCVGGRMGKKDLVRSAKKKRSIAI